MNIKFPWPSGPWQWVDSYDDFPVCPFIDPDTKERKLPSSISIEGVMSLRTIAKDARGMPTWVINAEPDFVQGDTPYIALQAFPEITDALASFVRAVEPFINDGDPATLKDRSPQIAAAYRDALTAFEKAGAIVGHEEQLELPL